MTARDKIQRAERATNRVYGDGCKALEFLDKRRSNNGWGVLHDPQGVQSDLLRARDAITAAIDELAAALKCWPRASDYDEVERENNRIDEEELQP